MALEDLGIRDVLAGLEQGRLMDILDEEFRKEAAMVKERGDKASVTLKINIAPTGPMDPMLSITADISTKDPQRTTRATFIYFHKGQFSRSDPRQMELPMGRSIDQEYETRNVERQSDSRKVE